MRLKFLFFPFALLFATVMTIWFIWPEWFDETTGVVAIKKEIAKEQADLSGIQTKKSNIANLKAALDLESAKKDSALRYYPDKEVTEKIINEVNYFASSSGASVVDLKVEKFDKKDKTRGLETRFKCLPVQEVTPISSADAVNETLPVIVSMRISASGGYENLRDFISRVSGMEIVNNVSTLAITREQSSATQTQGETAPIENKLRADMGVCFGYLPQTTVSREGNMAEHSIFSTTQFDFGYDDMIKKAVYKPAVDVVVGATGKSNPFIP